MIYSETVVKRARTCIILEKIGTRKVLFGTLSFPYQIDYTSRRYLVLWPYGVKIERVMLYIREFYFGLWIVKLILHISYSNHRFL